jgi:hypothetical protein
LSPAGYRRERRGAFHGLADEAQVFHRSGRQKWRDTPVEAPGVMFQHKEILGWQLRFHQVLYDEE